MLKNKAFKIRLYPNLKQQQIINQTIGNCRFWFNKCLGHFINWKKEHGDYKGFKPLTPKEAKIEFPWLSVGSFNALQQSQRDLDAAFRNMKNIGSGFPKFKKKGQKDSYREPQSRSKISSPPIIRIKNNKIKLLKLGWVHFHTSDKYIEQLQNIKICNVTISKNKYNQYFASVLCEINIEPKEQTNKIIGIDLGLKSFAFTSDGDEIENPKFLRHGERKIKRLQRQLSRKQKGSNRYEKQRIKLAKAHSHIANQRTQFIHQISTELINENQVICLEDLNVKGMVQNHKLAKSISDVSWYEFVRQLKYKADWYGRVLVQIDRFFPSSKLCNNCGWKNESLKLSDRTFICSDCGTEIDRDYNAALNILKQGMVELTKTESGKTDSKFVDTITSTHNGASYVDEAKTNLSYGQSCL